MEQLIRKWVFQYTKILALVSILLLVLPGLAYSFDEKELNETLRNCLAGNKESTISICKNYLDQGGINYSAYVKLAKLYQNLNRLDQAAEIYEKTLNLYGGNLRLKNTVIEAKSNSQEQAWLAENSKTPGKASVHRAKCVKFSNTVPKLAIDACNQYLQIDPADQEVIDHKKLAQTKLSNKGETYTAPEKPENDETIQIAKSDSSINEDKANSARSKESTSIEKNKIEVEIASVNQNTIVELRKELNDIYALIDKQKNTAVRVVDNYNEAGKRYALVIGNANYDRSIGRLANPVNDAKDISKALKKLGFEVTLLTDTNYDQLERTINKLATKIKADDTILFYYAGHGVAIDGENYLLPTKTKIKDVVDVKYKSVTLSYVLEKLDRGNSGVTMVILDACRNNPFPEARGTLRGGLANASGPVGTYIAYATAPGNVASDGKGRNGIYTKHLLDQLQKPNIKLEDMFKRVRIAVESETNGAQVPWENSSLKGDFYFNFEA